MSRDDISFQIGVILGAEDEYATIAGVNFRKELDALGLAVHQGWQPIETAPKDEWPPVLVTHEGSMWPPDIAIPRLDGTWGKADTGARLSSQPTHWMPLPEPPVAGSEESVE